jgi:peptidoglycan/LPS O-acetylase OafA/YrhL
VAARQLDLPYDYFGASVLWSIVCEEIYYAIYPLLRRLRAVLGWPTLIAIAFGASWGVALFCGDANYPGSGWKLTWLLGLPCWLLGCSLAEQSDGLWNPATWRAAWFWRFTIWLASCICLILRFHSPFGYPWTLNLFAALVFLWLRVEIRYYRNKSPWSALEWAGRWSYSLYLFHVIAIQAYVWIELPNAWPLKFAFVLATSYLFFLAVEKPSHRVARWLGREHHKSPSALPDSRAATQLASLPR